MEDPRRRPGDAHGAEAEAMDGEVAAESERSGGRRRRRSLVSHVSSPRVLPLAPERRDRTSLSYPIHEFDARRNAGIGNRARPSHSGVYADPGRASRAAPPHVTPTRPSPEHTLTIPLRSSFW